MPLDYTFRKIDRLIRFDTTNQGAVATLLPFAQTPNQEFEVQKISADTNTVIVQVDPTTSDFFPGNTSSVTLTDNTTNYMVRIKIPGDGSSPALVTGGLPGGSVPPPPAAFPEPPPVTIGDSWSGETEDEQIECVVKWIPDATATVDNFSGLKIYVEDPDISDKGNAPLDGTTPLDGTSGKAGTWNPVRFADNDESPVDITIPGKPVWRPVRIYLLSYSPNKTAKFVQANRPSPTPSVRLGIGGVIGEYVSGAEHAWLVTNVSATDTDNFDDPAGPTYHLDFSYDKPDSSIPLPKGLKPFGGVQITYEYDDGSREQGPFLPVDKQEEWHTKQIAIGSTQHYIVWFRSVDIDSNVNTIVKGLTPSVEVTVIYPPAGQATTPDVTGFALSNYRHEVEADGTDFALADLTWTPPDSVRFASVSFYRVDQQPPRLFPPSPLPANVTHTTLWVNDWPKTTQPWTIAAISTDYNGKMSADPTKPLPARVPTVVWNIGPPGLGSTGGEYTTFVGIAGVTIVTEQQMSNDGVQLMRHHIKGWTNPTDNSFGGVSIARVIAGTLSDSSLAGTGPKYWDAAKSDTSLDTEWEAAPGARSWDFYFVSRDMAGHKNTILPGVTPRITHPFTPIPGQIVPSRLPSGWWNEDEFSWPSQTDPAVDFSVKAIVSPKIFVGSILRVGGGNISDTGTADKPGYVPGTKPSFGAAQNGQIAVYNNANVLRAWMGQQDHTTPPAESSPRSVYGGWFAELYVGGNGPDTAPIYANQAGTVIVGGWDVKGSSYPYISIRDNTNLEVGRMGAKVAQGVPGVGPEAVNLAGAWFQQLGIGGQNLADWRILARYDSTVAGNNNVSLRQINKFTIDYQQNYPSSTNPTNYPVHLEYGYDAFVAEAANTSYWKHPGISLSDSNKPNQKLAIITRGIIAYGPDGYRKCAIYAWNGDQFGSDSGSQWWGEMTLYSTSNNPVVLISANDGGHANSSYLKMYDSTASPSGLNFSVDGVGNVFVRGGLQVGGALQLTGPSASFSVVGPISGTSFTAIGGGALVGGSLNVGSGNITCGNVNAAGYTIACYQINATNRFQGGDFYGSNVNVSTVTSSGLVKGSSFATSSLTVIDTSGNFVGNSVDIGTGIIRAGTYRAFIGGITYNPVNYDSFMTGDGRYVHVRAGIIVKIGDATPP